MPPMATTLKELSHWMRQADAARILGVSPQRVYALVKEGRLRSRLFPGVGAMVLREDVARYQKARRG